MTDPEQRTELMLPVFTIANFSVLCMLSFFLVEILCVAEVTKSVAQSLKEILSS